MEIQIPKAIPKNLPPAATYFSSESLTLDALKCEGQNRWSSALSLGFLTSCHRLPKYHKGMYQSGWFHQLSKSKVINPYIYIL